MSLLEKLKKLRDEGALPMHMPGHKRRDCGGELPYSLDITEIDGFDDLHHRTGILKELSERAAKLRNAEYAFPLVNGSTAGILAGIYAVTQPGDTVIIARNCHKSVYHACEIRNLNVQYIFPALTDEGIFLSVTLEDVETALGESPQAKAVVITSPIYEGIISDIERIAQIVHSRGAKLIVDAAHGAHLGYSEYFPKDAISLGADISVESLHKTLPSLTQTAVLFAREGVDADKIEYALDIFETSSPSYILMASIENCLDIIEKDSGKMFEDYSANLDEFYESVRKLEKLGILDFSKTKDAFESDRGKIVISCRSTDLSGPALADILREKYRIECEAAAPSYVIGMTSICDGAEDLRMFANALIEIDSSLSASDNADNVISYPRPEIEMSLCEASGRGGERIPLSAASGRISAEYLWAYPPGIPIIAPGEMITGEVIDYIEFCKNNDCNLLIPGRETADEISVK